MNHSWSCILTWMRWCPTGCKDQLSRAWHKRARGGGEHAQVQRCAEQWGTGRGDQTDGGLQIPLQVHEKQGDGHPHLLHLFKRKSVFLSLMTCQLRETMRTWEVTGAIYLHTSVMWGYLAVYQPVTCMDLPCVVTVTPYSPARLSSWRKNYLTASQRRSS